MVLDDTPGLITSDAFAGAVEAQLQTRFGGTRPELDEDAIQASLSASRHSRILTVEVTSDDRAEALAIGQAVAQVLPTAINTFLIADGAQPATVRIIDRPEEAVQDAESRRLILIVQTLVALGVGAGLAAFAAALDQKLYPENVEEVLGMPVLVDLRPPGRRKLPGLPAFGRPRGVRVS